MNIKVIKTLEDLEAVRTHWEKWQNHVNNDFAQFKLVCQLRPEIDSPYIVVIEKNNQPLALVAGRMERTQFAPSIGYLKPVRVSAKVVTVIHQGVLGHLDDETAKLAVRYFWSLLASRVADAIEFHHLSEHSPLLQALLVYGSPWFCEKKPRWSIHREMDLATKGEFIAHRVRSKHRSWIRKKQRELESAFSGQVAWRWMNCFDDISDLCARLEEVASLTYQRGLASGFVNNEEYRQRFALFARRGQLRVQLLEIGGRVRAFWFGMVYQGVFHSSETGYDPDLRKYEVGTLIFIRMVDELAREGVRRLDFGLGDAAYKERFGDQSWREATVWLFAPTAKGILLRSTQAFFVAMDGAARRLFHEVGLLERLKTAWRRRLAGATYAAKDKKA